MRTGEILRALAQEEPGISVIVNRDYTTCTLLYKPRIRSIDKTIFDAAFDLARQLTVHPNCPQSVKKALEEYNKYTEALTQRR